MKRLAMLAILFLLGSSATLAQQDMGRLSLEGSGYTTGVVEAATSDSMTIRKDTGEIATILLTGATVGDTRGVGSRVRVAFHRDDQNRAVADEIQGVAPIATQAAATMPLGVARPTPAATGAPVATAPAAGPATSAESANRVSAPLPAAAAPARRHLPATASLLPSLALLGLLAMSGALILRVAR
jgi:hypothetical protein